MSSYDGNFMDTSYWAPPPSPSILMVDQNDNGLNPIINTFPQTNLSTEHQSEQRYGGLGDRVAAITRFDLPPLQTENTSPFAASFRNPTLVPSPIPSVLLQSPNMFYNSYSQIIPPSPIVNDRPPHRVESSGGDHAITLMSNNDVAHPLMNVALPTQEGSSDIPTDESIYITSHESHVDPIGDSLLPSFESEVVAAETDIMNMISFESGSEDDEYNGDEDVDEDKEHNGDEDEDEDKEHNGDEDEDEDKEHNGDEDEDEDEDKEQKGDGDEEEDKEHNGDEDVDEDEEHDSVDVLDVKPPSPKRRKYEFTNMTGASRKCRKEKVIIQVESEDNHPDDGFNWRKYGQKLVIGNGNPRSYYRCTYKECDVKKYVERGAENLKMVVATYVGMHEHPPPDGHRRRFRSKNQSAYSMSHIGTPPYSSSAFDQPFPSPLAPHLDMTKLYMSGLSKLPSLPVNQNHGFVNRNDEPKIDRVIPEETEVYKGIREEEFYFGANL